MRKSFNGHIIETHQKPKATGTVRDWEGNSVGAGEVVICVDLRDRRGYYVLRHQVEFFFDIKDPPPKWILQKQNEHNAKMARALLEMLEAKRKKNGDS
jgi:hypothetical protein